MKFKKITGLCLLLIFFSGCYETGEIRTSEHSGAIYFTISRDYIKSKNADAYMLSDLSVARDDCEKDCIVWTIVRKPKSTVHATKLIGLPVKYGAPPGGMRDMVPPKILSEGKYTVAATVGLLNNNKVVGSGLVHDRFELIQDKDKSSLILK